MYLSTMCDVDKHHHDDSLVLTTVPRDRWVLVPEADLLADFIKGAMVSKLKKICILHYTYL
jgi:hypothetical protein